MKTSAVFLFCLLLAGSVRAQFLSGGLQDGGHGSGGDEKAAYTITANAGWNIVSLPVAVGDSSVLSVFPTALTTAFVYQGGYLPEDTLTTGPGYWLKFGAAQSISLNGALVNADTVPVAAGWNIVGSISSPIPSSAVVPAGTTILTSFFGFENGYAPAGTIEPGKGYWVKTAGAGTLVFSSGSVPAGKQAPVEEYLNTLNALTLVDASGVRQTLYFSSDADDSRFELPPVPPAGVFDARYASQRMVTRENQEILLSSAVFPVRLEWTIVTPGAYTLVINGKEQSLMVNGSAAVVQPSSHLALRIGPGADLPTEFALSQNYPNPFNPSTRIDYAVPAGSRPMVSLQVFDLLGRQVATLVNEVKEPGRYSVVWSAAGVASGVYYYRLNAGEFQSIRKMVVLK